MLRVFRNFVSALVTRTATNGDARRYEGQENVVGKLRNMSVYKGGEAVSSSGSNFGDTGDQECSFDTN